MIAAGPGSADTVPAVAPPPAPTPRLGGRVAAALSLLTAVVLALAAAIAYLGPIGAGPAVLAGIWFALLGVGTAASLALVVLYRTRTLTPRNPALASAAEVGAFVGVLFLSVWAVLWGSGLAPSGLPPLPVLMLVALPMALAQSAVTAAGSSAPWARRAMAAAAVLLPLPLSAVAVLAPSPAALTSSLPPALLLTATLAQIGGAFASVWTLTESSNGTALPRLAFLDADIHRRLQGLEARERSVLGRELTVTERERRVAATAPQEAPVASPVSAQNLERTAEFDKRLEEIAQERERLFREAQRLREFQDEVEIRDEEMATRAEEHEAVEKDLLTREQGLRQRETELGHLEAQIRMELGDLGSREVKHAEMEREIDARQAHLRTLESELETHRRQAAAGPALPLSKKDAKRVHDFQAWEGRLEKKEKELTEAQLKHRDERAKLNNLKARLDRSSESQRARDSELLEKHMTLVEREKRLEGWAVKLESRARTQKQGRDFLESLSRAAKAQALQSSTYLDDLGKREASMNGREEALQHAYVGLDTMRRSIEETLSKASAVNDEANARQEFLSLREQELQVREEQLQSREAELAGLAAGLASGKVQLDKVLELRERSLRKREEDFKRAIYEREKDLEIKQRALDAHRDGAAAEADEEAGIPAPVPTEERAKSGIERFDDLLYGGIPWTNSMLVIGPAFVGRHILVARILCEGLSHREPAILITTSKPPVDVATEIATVSPVFSDAERAGLVYWVDASSRTESPGRPLREGNRFRVDGAGDFAGIYEALVMLESELRARRVDRFRLAYVSLSQSMTQGRDQDPIEFVQKLVNRLRQSRHLGVYVVESGILTERQQQGLEHLCDGSVVFKKESHKNFLLVQGFTEVQTSDWVPYQFTRTTLHLGAFNLQRIK